MILTHVYLTYFLLALVVRHFSFLIYAVKLDCKPFQQGIFIPSCLQHVCKIQPVLEINIITVNSSVHMYLAMLNLINTKHEMSIESAVLYN